MRFLVDHCASRHVAEWLDAQGHDVVDAGALESDPGDQILLERAENNDDESVGAGYLERNWPPALKEGGAWPLVSLRQSFLDGSLTRLVDPDAVLRRKIRESAAA